MFEELCVSQMFTKILIALLLYRVTVKLAALQFGVWNCRSRECF